MNRVILTGRLTKDIDVRQKGDMSIGRFSIAVNRPYKNSEGEHETDFFNCVMFNVNSYIKENLLKGVSVAIDGRIQNSSYEVEGERRVSTDILVERIEVMNKPKDIPTDKLRTRTEVQQTFEYKDSDLPF